MRRAPLSARAAVADAMSAIADTDPAATIFLLLQSNGFEHMLADITIPGCARSRPPNRVRRRRSSWKALRCPQIVEDHREARILR